MLRYPSAPMFAPTVRVRRLAARVLLVWLFALATGIVNACVVAPGVHSMKTGRTGAMAVTSMPDLVDQHAGGCPDCPDEGTTTQPLGPCGKFCADEASGAPTAKLAFDPWPALGIAMVPTMGLSVAEPGHRPADRAEGPPARAADLPVPIAYLRLTL